MNKRGKFKALVILLACIFSVALSITAFFIKPVYAADVEESALWDNNYNSYTDSDIVDNERFDIKQYAVSFNTILDGPYKQTEPKDLPITGLFRSGIKVFNDYNYYIYGDDPIISIIPRELFMSPCKELIIGKDYGFFIETVQTESRRSERTSLNSSVLVFDIEHKKDNKIEKVKIKPLFQYDYAYVTAEQKTVNIQDFKTYKKYDIHLALSFDEGVTSAVVPLLQSFDMESGNYPTTGFVKVWRFALTNFFSAGYLYNEYNANQRDEGYVQEDDYGAFFIGNDFFYKGKLVTESGIDVSDAFSTSILVGLDIVASRFIPPLSWLGTLEDVLSVIDAWIPNTEIQSVNNQATYTSYWPTRTDQLARGDFIRYSHITMTEEFRENFFIEDEDEFFEVHYRTAIGNEIGSDWATRFVKQFGLSVVAVDYEAAHKDMYSDIIASGLCANSYPLDSNEEKHLNVADDTTCYILPHGVNEYAFIPEIGCYYNLTVKNPDLSVWIEILDADKQVILHSDADTLRCYFKQGEKYYIRTGYNDYNRYGSYKLSFKMDLPALEIGENIIDVNNSDVIYASYTPSKYLYYDLSLPQSVSAVYIGGNDLNFIQVEIINGRILVPLYGGETYYLKIEINQSLSDNIVIDITDQKNLHFKGAGESSFPTMTINSNNDFQMPLGTLRGYLFIGWNISPDASRGMTNAEIQAINSPDINLYSIWEKIYYNLSYAENGGSEVSDVTYTITDYVILNTSITRANYIFAGWYEFPDFRGNPVISIGSGVIGDKTFYAKWVKSQHKINLDIDSSFTDGVEAEVNANSITVSYNQKYTLPVPQIIGFDFEGWFYGTTQYANSDGSSLAPFLGESDITLQAKWIRQEYYIQIERTENGSTAFKWLTDNGLSGEQRTKQYVTNLSPSTWARENTAEFYKIGSVFEDLVTIDGKSAAWENLSSVLINGQIIKLKPSYVQETYLIRFSEYTQTEMPDIEGNYNEDINDRLIAPPKTGYQFVNWYIDGINDGVDGSSTGDIFSYEKMPDLSSMKENRHITAIIYLKAKFEPVMIKVKFDSVYTVNPSETKCKYDSAEVLPIVTMAGRVFNGWKYNEVIISNNNGGFLSNVIIDSNYLIKDGKWKILPPDENLDSYIVLVADWTGIEYRVTLNKQNGIGGADSVKATYGSAMPSAGKPSRIGYTFKGYYSGINGSGTQYYKADMNSAADWDIDKDSILYAYWKADTYTVVIDQQGGSGGSTTVVATYGELLPQIYSSWRDGYNFLGYYSGNGTLYYFYSCKEVWNIAQDTTLYAHWEPRDIVVAINYYDATNFSSLGTERYTVKFDTKINISAKAFSKYTFNQWRLASGNLDDSPQLDYYYASDLELTVDRYGQSRYEDLTTLFFWLTCSYTKQSCVAEGMLITLDDGTQKPVEQLSGNEMLLVWNLQTGQFDTAPILFIDSDAASLYKIINLSFSDGTNVKVIDEHAFWDFNLNQYVFLRDDAGQYIGHWFNKQITDTNGNLKWTKVQLVDVVLTEEYTTAWSPVTYGHFCYYVNGMLSMPGATTGLINIFEIEGETMTINQEQFLIDVETYGLFTYEEFAQLFPVPETVFEAFGGQYLKVSIGKGLIDYETLGELIARYADFFG